MAHKNGTNTLKCLSYNLHGFNQGSSLLNNTCNEVDCILIQEHWLTPANLGKIANFSKNFFFYGKSAMEVAVANSVLKGRPYGGVGILLKNNLLQYISNTYISTRIVAIALADFVIVSVYLPANGSANYTALISDTLDEIDSVLCDWHHRTLILGGDLNTDLRENNVGSILIKKFMTKHNCTIGNFSVPHRDNDLDFTYCHVTQKHYSYIDFFIVSSKLHPCILNFSILDKPCNLSDHNPILIEIKLTSPLTTTEPEYDASVPRLRWDHSNLQEYYDRTFQMACPILDRLNCKVKHDCFNMNCLFIESIYTDLVFGLKGVSTACISKKRSNFYKHWWSNDLELLKQESISTHRKWCLSNRPKTGVIFEAKTRAKANYKNCIKANQKMENCCISNSLHDALNNKTCTNFWKIWKSKFGCKPILPKCIDGVLDNHAIANEFLRRFIATSVSKTSAEVKENILNRLDNYVGDPVDPALKFFDIETVDTVINNLKFGKAPGIDDLTAEHLRYSHPIVVCVLQKLFNIMIDTNYVPNDFGMGITTPIPKGTSYSSSFEEYRGITISPLISKIFESCLLKKVNCYLVTSDRQFGFKKNTGCREAIHAVRSTVNHFVSNYSTINLCSIDMSKAFDRLDHFILFDKLMDRGIPVCYINLIVNWYSKTYMSVKWGNCQSGFAKCESGVRQGGILSPSLFNLVINDILIGLQNSNLGCFVRSECHNSYMYADDLILLSITITHMNRMTELCNAILSDLNMEINAKKTSIIRIGPRFKYDFKPVEINHSPIGKSHELKYLGITLLSNSYFSVNNQPARQKFFRALNGIFGKVGLHTSPTVLCSLIHSICVPLLFYSSEALRLTEKQCRNMEHAYMQIYAKIFKTFDKAIINSCQYHFGYLPFRLQLDIRKLNYLAGLYRKYCDGVYLHLCSSEWLTEFSELCSKYSFSMELNNYTACMIEYFERSFIL